jgi:Protein of unknown function (DUF3558)
VIRRYPLLLAGLALVLAGCSSTVAGNALPAPAAAGADSAPAVQNPLPAKVLDGEPCTTALTADDVTYLLGESRPPSTTSTSAGESCTWASTDPQGARFAVTYRNHGGAGLELYYQTIKPTADHWVTIDPVQGYPGVGYRSAGTAASDRNSCELVVAISDGLVYTVDLFLSANAIAKGTEACTTARIVADRVMTNLKAQAS